MNFTCTNIKLHQTKICILKETATAHRTPHCYVAGVQWFI